MSPKDSKNNLPTSNLLARDLMPKNKLSEQILRSRASYLSIAEDEKKEKNELIDYVKFHLGTTQRYGISYHYAKEVILRSFPTKIPFVPAYIIGVINRRGALLPVIDLKQLFHIKPTVTEYSPIILVTYQHMTVGILADQIDGSDAYEPSKLDASLTSAELIKPNYIIGLHQGVTAIINIEAILADTKNVGKEII